MMLLNQFYQLPSKQQILRLTKRWKAYVQINAKETSTIICLWEEKIRNTQVWGFGGEIKNLVMELGFDTRR